jgi:eukaryotic translation initiation factor 2C
MRKLDKNLTDEMMKFTRQNPNVRANKIHDGLNILNYKGNEYLKQFGMEVSRDMAVVGLKYYCYIIGIFLITRIYR